ncbi:TetR/AcrR family transcriptional regulator [Sinomonas sp. G460-2]|uniref:TetR/AcrR family transcriptional regulator n=1 Tax=Sinomonas sp. G460-2 TaxID=3393464 RepID=UPI0039EE9C70
MARLAPRSPRRDDPGTRGRLLETAGLVFAERGFDRATSKEICDRAGTNTAAVNYYFGGIAGLYEAVLEEIPRRLVTIEAISSAMDATDGHAPDRLSAFTGVVVGALTGPAAASWPLRVIARELVAPASIRDGLRLRGMYPGGRLLRALVSELTGLPDDHPDVAPACLSVAAPFLMLLICDRPTLDALFPGLGLDAADSEALADRIVRFTLGGLTGIAAPDRGNP